MKNPGNVYEQVISVTDWLPSLLKAADIKYPIKDLDGTDFWEQIIGNNRTPKRRTIVHVLDDIFEYQSIRDGDWKYVNGSRYNDLVQGWVGEVGNETMNLNYLDAVRNSDTAKALKGYGLINDRKMEVIRNKLNIDCGQKKTPCDPFNGPCLFHIDVDPCEMNNVVKKYPQVLKHFEDLLAEKRKFAVPSVRTFYVDPLAHPSLHNYTWSWWM